MTKNESAKIFNFVWKKPSLCIEKQMNQFGCLTIYTAISVRQKFHLEVITIPLQLVLEV